MLINSLVMNFRVFIRDDAFVVSPRMNDFGHFLAIKGLCDCKCLIFNVFLFLDSTILDFLIAYADSLTTWPESRSLTGKVESIFLFKVFNLHFFVIQWSLEDITYFLRNFVKLETFSFTLDASILIVKRFVLIFSLFN